jgi:hypothetical protein
VDEVIAIIDKEEAGEMISTSTSRVAEAGLLSREATAAAGSAFTTLTETAKKHEPSLEYAVLLVTQFQAS